jgi:Xaa-Pro aminopeptidase
MPAATLVLVERAESVDAHHAAGHELPYARARGVPDNTMDDAWGHGSGLAFDPPWITGDNELVLQPGMCLAIERRIAATGRLGAQYEDNLLLTPTGPELLSRT